MFEEGSWRIRSNNEIEHILEKEEVVRFIMAGRIKWLGHVQRMNEERILKRRMHAIMEGTRRQSHPKSR